ncbi:hypothetical protein G3M48_000204 [Beauveria asiatica]|uniref:Uncharacterized protein n=1 Tax=Beauveria asiatica TaxID=1069075 RepID=A0AAW0RH50_9HYPO
MKRTLAPSEEESRRAASYAYDDVINPAKINTTKASKWIEEWEEAYALGVRYGIPEIESALAVDKFLEAVRVRFDEQWATAEQRRIIARSLKNKGAPLSLANYARFFRDVAALKERSAARVLPTAPPKPDNSDSRGRNNNNNKRGSHECPCGRNFNGKGHKWRPFDCRFVRAAINAPASGFHISEANAKDIVSRLREPKWKSLRIQLSNSGFHLPPRLGNDQSKAQPSINLPDGDLRHAFKQTGVATSDLLINSNTLQHMDAGMRHRLYESTIWDTGSAFHVVNERKLLDEGSFYVERGSVGAGDSKCQILGYGTRPDPSPRQRRRLVTYLPGLEASKNVLAPSAQRRARLTMHQLIPLTVEEEQAGNLQGFRPTSFSNFSFPKDRETYYQKYYEVPVREGFQSQDDPAAVLLRNAAAAATREGNDTPAPSNTSPPDTTTPTRDTRYNVNGDAVGPAIAVAAPKKPETRQELSRGEREVTELIEQHDDISDGGLTSDEVGITDVTDAPDFEDAQEAKLIPRR